MHQFFEIPDLTSFLFSIIKKNSIKENNISAYIRLGQVCKDWNKLHKASLKDQIVFEAMVVYYKNIISTKKLINPNIVQFITYLLDTRLNLKMSCDRAKKIVDLLIKPVSERTIADFLNTNLLDKAALNAITGPSRTLFINNYITQYSTNFLSNIVARNYTIIALAFELVSFSELKAAAENFLDIAFSDAHFLIGLKNKFFTLDDFNKLTNNISFLTLLLKNMNIFNHLNIEHIKMMPDVKYLEVLLNQGKMLLERNGISHLLKNFPTTLELSNRLNNSHEKEETSLNSELLPSPSPSPQPTRPI